MPASASARSTTWYTARTWSREASSGTTPPYGRCTSSCPCTQLDAISRPSRTTAAAISSHELSMPSTHGKEWVKPRTSDAVARAEATVRLRSPAARRARPPDGLRSPSARCAKLALRGRCADAPGCPRSEARSPRAALELLLLRLALDAELGHRAGAETRETDRLAAHHA